MTQNTSPIWLRHTQTKGLFLVCWLRSVVKYKITHHDLGKDEHDDIGRLAARYGIEELDIKIKNKSAQFGNHISSAGNQSGAYKHNSFTLVRVMSKPRMDVTIIIPTKMKEMCWDQNFT